MKLVLLDLVPGKEMMHIVWKMCSTVDKLTSPAGTVISSTLFGLCSLPDLQDLKYKFDVCSPKQFLVLHHKFLGV